MKHRIEAHATSRGMDGVIYYSAKCLCGWAGPWSETRKFECERDQPQWKERIGTWQEEAVRLGKALNGAVVVSKVGTFLASKRYVRAIFGREFRDGYPLLEVQQSDRPDFGPHYVEIHADKGDQYQLRCECGWRGEWSKTLPVGVGCPLQSERLWRRVSAVSAAARSRCEPRLHSLSETSDGCSHRRLKRVVCLCGWTGRETSSAFKIADRLQRGCPEDRESVENKAAREKAQARAERKQVIEHDERVQAACRGTQARRQALRETTVEQALADMTAREKASRKKYEEKADEADALKRRLTQYVLLTQRAEARAQTLEENLQAEVSTRSRLEADLREALGKAQDEIIDLRRWRDHILSKLFTSNDPLTDQSDVAIKCNQAGSQISLLHRIAGDHDKLKAWVDSVLVLIFGSSATVNREEECEQAFGAIRALMNRAVKS